MRRSKGFKEVEALGRMVAFATGWRLQSVVVGAGAAIGRGMLLCPICFNSGTLSEEDLTDGSQLGGGTPL